MTKGKERKGKQTENTAIQPSAHISYRNALMVLLQKASEKHSQHSHHGQNENQKTIKSYLNFWLLSLLGASLNAVQSMYMYMYVRCTNNFGVQCILYIVCFHRKEAIISYTANEAQGVCVCCVGGWGGRSSVLKV